MSRAASSRKSERGVTLVLMALMLFLVLGMSALAVDYGMVKSTKAEAQRAVDAAALAGASAFLESNPAVNKVDEGELRARDYAKKHMVHESWVQDAEIGVNVDLPNETITVTYTGNPIPLWFAQAIGFARMGINAVAVAHAFETSNAACVMPVAIPDLWKNNDIIGPSADNPEEKGTPDAIWSYRDLNNNGWMDPGTGNTVERELWEFDPGIDVYDATGPDGTGPPDGKGDVGYGTTARNSLGGSDPFMHKTNDYGRQIMLMNLSPKDGTTSSNYYAWGFNSSDANSGDILREKISDPSCEVASVSTEYPASAGNGATAGTVSPAWDTRIGYDRNAWWDDATNTVQGSYFDDLDGDGLPDGSPRVVIVAMYNPELELQTPSDNEIVFNNFAKIWVDQRPPGCSGAGCKSAITGRFLGFVEGAGAPGGATTGSLIKRIQLIR